MASESSEAEYPTGPTHPLSSPVPPTSPVGSAFLVVPTLPPAYMSHRNSSENFSIFPSDASSTTATGYSTPISTEYKGLLGKDAYRNYTKTETGGVASYSVVTLARKDDIEHMAIWKQRLYKATPFITVCILAANIVYLFLRVRFTLDAQRHDKEIFYMAWVFIAVELGVVSPMVMHQFWSLFIIKSRVRQKLRLLGPEVPSVDVVVTCCGEDHDVILDTLRAAADVDYPTDRFKVILLDDGHDSALETAVTHLKERIPNLYYRSREKIPGVPHNFKAGNLNYALEETANMKAGTYFAALDADMIPEKDWLRAIIAPLIVDDRLALVCPPQVCVSYSIPLILNCLT